MALPGGERPNYDPIALLKDLGRVFPKQLTLQFGGIEEYNTETKKYEKSPVREGNIQPFTSQRREIAAQLRVVRRMQAEGATREQIIDAVEPWRRTVRLPSIFDIV